MKGYHFYESIFITYMPFSNKQIKIDMQKDFKDFFTMYSLFLEIEILKELKIYEELR